MNIITATIKIAMVQILEIAIPSFILFAKTEIGTLSILPSIAKLKTTSKHFTMVSKTPLLINYLIKNI